MPKKTPKNTLQTPLKAYGYVRVSTEEQAKEGISLEAQKAKIQSFATLKDLNLIEIITDESVSGKDLDRPGLKRLLNLVKGHDTEAVIVYKLDRLSRRTRDLLFLIEDVFKKGNTRFFSITEQIDTDTAIGKFFLTIMGAMAQMERELIAERTKATLGYKKEKGESLGHIPYGYQRINGKLVINHQEQKVIRKIKRLRKQGKGYKKIAELLNNQGIPVRNKKANWHNSTVWYVVKGKIRS
jgi:DNA invertase Pin-like site-specific DNA recombinase